MNHLTTFCMAIVLMTGCYGTNGLDGEPVGCETDCDDSDPCTEDVCDIAGECQHFAIPGCGSECAADLDCEDGVDCTFDYCDAAGLCQSVDMCGEEVCESEIHSFALPISAHDMDVTVKGDTIALVLQETDEDLTMSYFAATPLDAPAVIARVNPIDSRDNVGIHHPRVLWPEDNPIVFWSSWEEATAPLMMAEFDVASDTLASPIALYSAHQTALSQVVYHPNGELGIGWSQWIDSGSDPVAMFGRFSLTGEEIQISEISDGGFAYGPRLKPELDGYSLFFTSYLTDSGQSNVMRRGYSFSGGMYGLTRLNADDGRFVAGPVAGTSDQELALIFHDLSPEIRLLNLAILADGEDHGSVPPFLMSSAADALGSPEGDEAYISWCTPELPDAKSAVSAIRVSGSSISLVFYHEMIGDGVYCEDVELVQNGEEFMVFWLDTKNTISYRSLCLP